MEQLTIKTRPRNAQEVVSLGFLIGKRYFFPLWVTTIAAMLPFLLFSIATIAIMGKYAWEWGVFVLWLGKPYFERPVLLVLSRLIFGETWQLSDIKKDLKKSLTGRLWLYLILRSNSRVSQAAVRLLENLDGTDLKQRLKYVNKKSHMTSVVIGLSFIEAAFIVSLVVFIFTLLPPDFYAQSLKEILSLSWLNFLFYGFIFLAFSVSNVFFTAIGFMDYLNQRIISEGWAIALDLQALANRLVVIIFFAVIACFPYVSAQANSPTVKDSVNDIEQTASYLGDKEFLLEKAHNPNVTPFEEKRYRVKKDHRSNSDDRFFHFSLGNMSESISRLIRGLVICLLIGGFIWLVLLIRQGQKVKTKTSPTKKKPSSSLEIETISLQHLITNPEQKAWELLNAGKETEALSILYRASLQKLAAEFAFFAQEGDSDEDCLRKSRPLISQTAFVFLEKLISYWQKAAYGGCPPPREAIGQCIDEFTRLWA